MISNVLPYLAASGYDADVDDISPSPFPKFHYNRNNNHKTSNHQNGSINHHNSHHHHPHLPPILEPAGSNKHLTFSTHLRHNAPHGPTRVHKPIKTKKRDAPASRRRNNHHNTNLIPTNPAHAFPQQAFPLEHSNSLRDNFIIEVDSDEDHPSSSSNSALDDLSHLNPLLPADDVDPQRYYQDLLDNLVCKRALYESEIGQIDKGEERRALKRRLREISDDMVVLVRRRGDFKLMVAVDGLEQDQKRECLERLARSIIKSGEI